MIKAGRSERRAIFNLFLVLLMWVSVSAWAEPVLPHLISDGAVFQQGREIHVWGKADPQEKITVSLSQNSVRTGADAWGRWSVLLPAMQAGGPFTLRISGKTAITIKDVLIGEVWVASGQSNMTFALRDSIGAAEELPKADYPEIRMFTVPKRVSLSPQPDTLPASWQPCTAETAATFSAVAYYFARDLHNKLKVPIGIIESAWPGTTIEEWIALEVAERHPAIKTMLDEWDSHERRQSGGQAFDLQFDDFELLPAPANRREPLRLANFDDGSVRNSLGGYASYDGRTAPETTFELASPGRGGSGFAAHIAGQITAADDSRLTMRFHTDLSPADLSPFDGIRFWVRGSGMFRFRSLQPTITDWDDYSTSALPASSEWTPVTIWFRDLRQEGWGVTRDFTPHALTGLSIESLPATGYPGRPASGLYHGMITPLLPFPFRGAIWYQGESNALKAIEYRTLLPALIESWRAVSHQPDMQFLIVQLPNHGAIPGQPTESAWAELREAQLLTARQLHGVGLAVTIDLGDPNDVHPHRKAEVGERLALWALGATYQRPVVYSGPLYDSMVVEGKRVRIRFNKVGRGLIAKGNGILKGFAIAGQDHKFYWADAIIDGESVLVSSPEVPSPVAVRYGWADSPECNLLNDEGLPASPFRTDQWTFKPNLNAN